jgi:hypothetical protein
MWGEVNMNNFIEKHANSIICEPSGLTYNQLKENKIQKMMIVNYDKKHEKKVSHSFNSKLPICENLKKQKENRRIPKPKSIDEIHRTVDQVIDQKMELFNSILKV